jgi:RHS repeat-associated protein
MSAVARLHAWQDAQAAARQVVAEQGLPREVHEGAAISRYGWRAGELAEIVEADGERWSYAYGDDGRLLAVDRDGRRWADYGYDAAGRLSEVCRPDGPLAHSYDEQGRLLRTLRGDASPFVYRWQDERVASARSDHEESHFHYDARGRVTGIDQRVDGHELSLRFSFDGQGRLQRLDFPQWQQTISFAWDARGRPAAVDWNVCQVASFGSDDAARRSWAESRDGVRSDTWHEAGSGRPTRQVISRQGQDIRSSELRRDEAFRLLAEGSRRYRYDFCGRLCEAREGDHVWRYQHDARDNVLADDGADRDVESDSAGRIRRVRQGASERVFRHNQAGELLELLVDGKRVARCLYDHKGRLILKSGPQGSERYLYGPDDALLAIADGAGNPRLIYLRLPTGIVGMIDFREDSEGRVVCLHCDAHGNLLFAGSEDDREALAGPFASDPYGLPLAVEGGGENPVPYLYRGRLWHADLGLYRIGGRWYDPALRRFLTPDTYTGAPDDARLLNPFRKAGEQRMARAQILADWLRQPRLRNRTAYCANDPINRFDPDGHWSFGGVLLSLLGVLWTLPNTAFGLAIEVTCLLGEVVRWLVWLFSGGNVSWQTPGFDAAASGRLNAFALVFKGGWLGSFESLLGITFGNVIFVNGEYEQHPEWKRLPDPVSPPAYGGAQTIPKSQALYEHELRHVNQYSWWGPFFHLGLPLFGVYEWDVILNGYQNASFEQDAREHGGF